jgi:hypothetical protein
MFFSKLKLKNKFNDEKIAILNYIKGKALAQTRVPSL